MSEYMHNEQNPQSPDDLPDALEQARVVVERVMWDVGVEAEAQRIADDYKDPVVLVVRDARSTVDSSLDCIKSVDNEATPHPLIQTERAINEARIGMALEELFRMMVSHSPKKLLPELSEDDIVFAEDSLEANSPAPSSSTDELTRHREYLVAGSPPILRGKSKIDFSNIPLDENAKKYLS